MQLNGHGLRPELSLPRLVSSLVFLLSPQGTASQHQVDPPSCSQQLRAVFPLTLASGWVLCCWLSEMCPLETLPHALCNLGSCPVALLHRISSVISCAHSPALSTSSFRNLQIPTHSQGPGVLVASTCWTGLDSFVNKENGNTSLK